MRIELLEIWCKKLYLSLFNLCIEKYQFFINFLGYAPRMYLEVRSLFGITFGKRIEYQGDLVLTVDIFWKRFEKVWHKE